MAYLDYRISGRHRTQSRQPARTWLPQLAWERLAVIAICLGAWTAIILAARALF
ncbi:hypothetical protein [Caulobacter sp. LARHSG274]